MNIVDKFTKSESQSFTTEDWETETFAQWFPVLYDLDSCFGVDNVSYINTPYNVNFKDERMSGNES